MHMVTILFLKGLLWVWAHLLIKGGVQREPIMEAFKQIICVHVEITHIQNCRDCC